MNRNRIVKALLFPHIAVLILLLPIATMFLVYSMVELGSKNAISIASYVLAAYALTVWCCRIPLLIRFFRNFRKENRFAKRWQEDDRLRINVSLYGSLIWNIAYAAFQLWLGVYHRTFWFYSLAGYYLCLALMRFFLVRHTSRHRAGEQMHAELLQYRACGWVFLFMNAALSLIIFFMVYWNRTFVHHEITTIAMAAYTFTAFTFALINLFKYRKYKSPVYSASKAISLAAACVSILTLESTMLNTWGGQEDVAFRQLMLALTGLAISVLILTMAIYMISQGTKNMKQYQKEEP